MTQAAVCAVVFEFLGAITAGGKVSSTVQKGIMKASLFKNKEGLMQLGFTVALMASASWLQIANYLSLPVSTTHSVRD
jgi:PiT family inorganic phosphate transporter